MQVYSARHVQQLQHQMEQAKTVEITRMGEEMQRYLADKEEEMRARCAAAEQSLAAVEGERATFARVVQENAILKQGVRAQQGAVERVRAECEGRQAAERAEFAQAGAQAAEHIRRLEHQNYTLRVQLEQLIPTSTAPEVPRWGEGY